MSWQEDYERPEFFQTRFGKARKSYVCATCRGIIAQGEQYKRVTMKMPGEKVQTYREHVRQCDFERDEAIS